MANTEGIPDEKLASLLSIDNTAPSSPSSNRRRSNAAAAATTATTKIPRGFIERQRMMDAYTPSTDENDRSASGGSARPSAKVIRSSNRNNPPIIQQSKSKSKFSNKGKLIRIGSSLTDNGNKESECCEDESESEDKGDYSRIQNESFTKATMLPPAILSNSIQERPNAQQTVPSSNYSSSDSVHTKKVSKFKQRQQTIDSSNNANGTTTTNHSQSSTSHLYQKSGFPSFDHIPFGSLTRKGKGNKLQNMMNSSKTNNGKNPPSSLSSKIITNDYQTNTITTNVNSKNLHDNNNDSNSISAQADTLLAKMTPNEIQENIHELHDMLSPETIAFLKQRTNAKIKKKKNNENAINATKNVKEDGENNQLLENEQADSRSSGMTMTNNPSIIINDYNSNSKEQLASLLSNIQTEEELDDLYQQTMITNFDGDKNTNQNQHQHHQQQQQQQQYTTSSTYQHDESESEIERSTKLLRSTVLRQRLLGAKSINRILNVRVHQRLSNQQNAIATSTSVSSTSISSTTMSKEENQTSQQQQHSLYPKLLPVALRCILDLPSPTTKHSILFSNVLQSIHSLILLFVHEEHIIYFGNSDSGSTSSNKVDCGNNNVKSIHQLWYMDDYIPIPSSRNLYSSSLTPKDNDKNESTPTNTISSSSPGCYTTDSSAESAEKDSIAFYNDPLWTLLSRMKILPCITHILTSFTQKSHHHNSEEDMIAVDYDLVLQSVESISSICGILAMLSARSPGAACAIAQHKSIIPILIALTLQPRMTSHEVNTDGDKSTVGGDKKTWNDNDDNHCNEDDLFVVHTKLALPTIRMICTLCRQSRTIAISDWMTSVMDSVTMILSTKAEKDDEWDLQRWCIILWRTLLRYGLAISYTSTILPMSIPDLTPKTTDHKGGYSLSSYYLTAYALLCNCVKICRNDEKVKQSLNDVDCNVLESCSLWLASHVKTCAECLGSPSFSTTTSTTSVIEDDEATTMHLTSARIRLLHSYASVCDIKTTELNKVEIPIVSREAHITALKGVVQAKILHQSLLKVLGTSVSEDKEEGLIIQACACSLVHSFFTSLSKLLHEYERHNNDDDKEDHESNDVLLGLISDTIEYTLSLVDANDDVGLEPKDTLLCVRHWKNKAHFAIAMLLAEALASNVLHLSSSALPLTQSFCFTLIGKFEQGEEAKVAMILSQRILFFIKEKQGLKSMESVSMIQEVILREIMETSKQSQAQFDHSFKLMGGSEESPQIGGGPFLLESLRSEADCSIDPRQSADDSRATFEVLTLPLGNDWLYKLLCGKIELGDDANQKALRLQNTSNIVISALKLILYMEDELSRYTKCIPSGSKLYFMLNACLFPEEIIRHDTFRLLFTDLFHRYHLSDDQSSEQKAKSFIVTCYRHSLLHQANDSNKSKDVTEDQILALFFDSRGGEEKQMKLSPKNLKAVDDFISDVCTAFTHYGAQYDFFCISMRFLLMPGFPSRNRIIILNQLKDLLHLLTTETELEDLACQSVKQALCRSFSGGLPIQDGSKRDQAELLDVLGSMIQKEKYSSVCGSGFFYLYSIGTLARNLSSSSIRCECGLNAMKRRLCGSKREILEDIFTVAFALTKDMNGTVEVLVDYVVQSCVADEGKSSKKSSWAGDWYESSYGEKVWNAMVEDLRCTFHEK